MHPNPHERGTNSRSPDENAQRKGDTSWLRGGGEIGAAIREKDWSDTCWGAVDGWPVSLRTSVEICLGSNVPNCIYWGRDYRLIYNDSWSKTFADNSLAFLGEPAKKFFSEQWPGVQRLFENVRSNGKAYDSENDSNIRASNVGLGDSFTLSPLRDEEGGVAGLFHSNPRIPGEDGYQSDHEKRHRVDRELFDSLPVVVYTTDPNGYVTFYNAEATKFAGRPVRVGKDRYCVTWKLFNIDGSPMRHDECPMAISLRDNRAIQGARAMAERPDGSRIWFDAYPSPIRNEEGAVCGGINVLIDVTERERHEQLLNEQKKLLQLIATGYDLDDCLEAICKSIPNLNSGAGAVISLIDSETDTISRVVAPDLPSSFRERIEGASTSDPILGTFAHAILTGDQVSCSSVEEDDTWPEAWRTFWLEQGIKSCSFSPVIDKDSHVMGSFLLYFEEPRDPSEWEQRLGDFGSDIACVAVQRDRSERALKESEERLRYALSAAGMSVWELDLQQYASPISALRHAQIFGYEGKNEWDFDTVINNLHSDEREHIEATYQKAVETGEWEFECRMVRSDESVKWMAFQGCLYKNEAGELEHGIGVFQDITERKEREHVRKKLQKRLRNNWRRLKDAFDQAPSFMSIMQGPDHVYTRANKLYYQLVGDRDLIGKPIREALPELEGQDIFDKLDHVYNTGETYVSGVRRMTLETSSDSEERYIKFVYQPIQDPDDSVRGVFVHGVDLTERKEFEIELAHVTARSEQQKRLYEALLDSTPDLLYVIDRDYRFTYANEALLDMWGKTPDESIGQNLLEIGYEPWHAEMHEKEFEKIIETRQPVRGEVAFPHAELGTRIYEYIFVPVLDERGKVDAIAGTARDITERRHAEDALKELNETLEERVQDRTETIRHLASKLTMAEQEERRRISHILHEDVQQLLYGVQLRMTIIRRNLESNSYANLPQHVDEASDHVADAIEKTRQLTVDLSPPILLGEGLRGTIEWLQAQMAEMHDLEVEIEAEHEFLIPDEDMRVLLFQIVRELLFNVVKHADTDHALVKMFEDENQLVISVIDKGRGFDVSAAEESEGSDTGFGLFSVRERLHLFGGSMDIRSQVGEGTSVTIHTTVTTG